MSHPSSPPDLSRELDVAKRLAVAAGRHILGYHGSLLTVDRKAGNEPVTRADRESSDLIVDGLRQAFPDDVFISEEEPDDPARLVRQRVWFVDPLDGTKDFVRGEDGFSVMIGLVIDGRPRVGAVYQPIGDSLYSAAWGLGAWAASATGDTALRVSIVASLAEIRLVASKSHRVRVLDDIKNALGIANEMNVGSVGLKISLIARDVCDLYVSPATQTKAWDSCAPEAILHEAGGRLTDALGQPLRYDAPDLHHAAGLVASNGLIHDAVVAKLAPFFPGARP